MKLTKDKIDQYIENPFVCPNCGSDEIISEDFDFESYTVTVKCHSCKSKWYEIYTLKSIEKHE